MDKKLSILFIIVFSFFLLLSAGATLAQGSYGQLKIISSTNNNTLLGTSIFVMGEASPNTTMLLSIKDDKDVFSYSIKTTSDSQGNWSANFDQSLRSGKYYIEAVEQDPNGYPIRSVRSDPIKIRGSFAFIVGIFSILVIILLAGFVGGWYINKLAETKRFRRILMSQRDIVASYNVLKKDVDRAREILHGTKEDKWKVTEADFFVKRIEENLEKMNKYVVQGINIIGKYDVITKINNFFKLSK